MLHLKVRNCHTDSGQWYILNRCYLCNSYQIEGHFFEVISSSFSRTSLLLSLTLCLMITCLYYLPSSDLGVAGTKRTASVPFFLNHPSFLFPFLTPSMQPLIFSLSVHRLPTCCFQVFDSVIGSNRRLYYLNGVAFFFYTPCICILLLFYYRIIFLVKV